MSRSLREQLSEVRPSVRLGPTTRVVMQALADIPDVDESDRLSTARQEALKWATKRAGQLPQAAWDLQTFDLDAPGTPASAVRLQTETADYWVLRLNDPDKGTPGQIWSTEITISASRGRGTFGLRQTLLTRHPDVAITPGVPGVVLQIAESVGLTQDGLAIDGQPWVLGSEAAVDRFVQLLTDPQRRLSILLVTLPDGDDPSTAVLDANRLARRALGLAHVVVMPASLTFRLTDQIGKRFSAFLGAVRTYRPGFDTITDSPYQHPLAMPHAITSWGDEGPNAFIDFAIGNLARDTTGYSEDDLPPFARVQKLAAGLRHQRALQEKPGAEEERELANEVIETLQGEIEILEQLSQDEVEKRRQETARAEESESRELVQLARIQSLEAELEALRSEPAPIEIPDTLDELQPWAEQYLTGRVLLTPKALRAAKQAKFEDAPLVYQALLLLGREYHASKTRGGADCMESMDARLKELGLENSRSGEDTRLREQGDEFLVRHKGRKVLLKWHLKNGNSRDPRRCLRIYYAWSDEDQMVIVGSLPGHLHTRAS